MFYSSHPLRYVEPVYRPPAEAESLLVQVTLGCSHNGCSFCAMYRGKSYSVRSTAEVLADLERAADFYGNAGRMPRKIFLCDGDALGAPVETLRPVLAGIKKSFPACARVGIYASARNILEKSESELRELQSAGLRIAYLGAESGAEPVLKLINKGVNAEETFAAVRKIKAAGWKVSLILMLGIGGRTLSREHCRESARLISETAPNFLSFLTTVIIPGTAFARMVADQRIAELTIRELLMEMRDIIGAVAAADRKIIFRANHVSNLYPLEGILPRDRERLVAAVEAWIAGCPPDAYPSHDPRAL